MTLTSVYRQTTVAMNKLPIVQATESLLVWASHVMLRRDCRHRWPIQCFTARKSSQKKMQLERNRPEDGYI